MKSSQAHIESAQSRPVQFRLRTAMLGIGVVGVLLGTEFFGLVGLRYPRDFDNNPFVAPIRVITVEGDKLILEDGRVLRLLESPWLLGLQEVIQRSGHEIDIEEHDPGSVFVYVKERRWTCGSRWVRMINVPLIPDNIPMYWRVPYGMASIGSEQDLAGDCATP